MEDADLEETFATSTCDHGLPTAEQIERIKRESQKLWILWQDWQDHYRAAGEPYEPSSDATTCWVLEQIETGEHAPVHKALGPVR